MSTKKIDLMVIGTQKAGTTAINNFLAQHPRIITHNVVEFTYFLEDAAYADGYEARFKRFFNTEGMDADSLVVAKNVGVMYSETALRRLFEHNPQAKLIVLLRNPIERAYSSYWYAVSKGWESIEDFKEAAFSKDTSRFGGNHVAQRNCQYLQYGLYYQALQLIYSIFPKEQVHVYIYEDIRQDMQGFLNGLLGIMGIKESFVFDVEKQYNELEIPKYWWLAQMLQVKGKLRQKAKWLPKPLKEFLKLKLITENKSAAKRPPLDPALKEELKGFFKQDTEQLMQALGRSQNPWS